MIDGLSQNHRARVCMHVRCNLFGQRPFNSSERYKTSSEIKAQHLFQPTLLRTISDIEFFGAYTCNSMRITVQAPCYDESIDRVVSRN